jgi:chlorite dismutase
MALGGQADSQVMTQHYVHAWLLRLDPVWRRRARTKRQADIDALCAALTRSEARLRQVTYSTVGLRTEGDLLLWRMAEHVEDIADTAADILASGLGRWLTPAISLIGLTRPSEYVRRPTTQEQNLFIGERSKYLIAYPFTKSADWYLTPAEERASIMRGHMKVGHQYPQVRQLLAYSFGLDDQEFIVAYETDDLVAFQDLVRDLRATESRRATVRDTPIIVGIRRPAAEILTMLSGSNS